MAAEILGIQFSRAEQELNINVIQAQIQNDRSRDGSKKVINQQNQQHNGTEEENKGGRIKRFLKKLICVCAFIKKTKYSTYNKILNLKMQKRKH